MRRGEQTYLYPPATTSEFGHFVFASLNSLTASAIAAWLVPPGRKLDARSAVYGPPTPWTQTFAAP